MITAPMMKGDDIYENFKNNDIKTYMEGGSYIAGMGKQSHGYIRLRKLL